MTGLLFGTGGSPLSSKPRGTLAGIKRIAELGLGCMELEFVYGVRLSDAEADQVANTASKLKIRLSAHAPYYINLNAHEHDKLISSQDWLLQTVRVANRCGAMNVVFHPASYMKDAPEEVYGRVKQILIGIVAEAKKANQYLWLRPELMGKGGQFGNLEELLNLCSEVTGLAPCIDFAHLHARTGKYNSYYEFKSVLNQIEKKLGRAFLDNMHIHLSGIKYTKGGESSHLNIRDSDFNYAELFQAIKEQDVKGLLICESPNLEEDALHLQETYFKM
jgi:deoxyribonuclease-4